MLSYGGAITSAFPNSFCISPSSITCQICGISLSNEHGNTNNSSNKNLHSFLFSGYQSSQQNRSMEKCNHCGINLCEKCFNENHENHLQENNIMSEKNMFLAEQFYQQLPVPKSTAHYNVVKKEFKQMYNYSKEIVEKLHMLNNAIKIEESAVSELNSIKHKVNTKAIELIKQINQEKVDLIEQIDNVKRKYES